MGEFSSRHIGAADIPKLSVYLEIKSGGVYSKEDWLRILRWIWIDNPNVDSETIFGWLVVDEKESIRGVLGNIAAQCFVHGQPQKSYWATTWFVDEEARNLSIDLFMRYVKQGGLLMSNTPNPSVEKMLTKAFKYHRADAPWFHGSFLFPVKPLKDYFSGGKNKTSLIKRTALMGGSVLLKVPQVFAFLQHRSNKIFRQLSVEQVQNFSGETDEWFSEFSKQHSCVMSRSAAMYQWLFLDPNNKNAFKAFEIKFNHKILGYMVFKTKYNATSGFHYMELVDEALLLMPADVLEQVIAKTYYEANRSATNESMLLMRSNNEETRATLRKLYGIRVKKVEKTYFKQSFLKSGEQPFLTSLDGDSIFF